MGDSLVAAKFSFSRRLRLPQREGRAEARKAQLGAFLRDALNDATVKRAVPLGGTSSTGATLAAGVTEVVFSELAVTKTSMSFFDRLEAEGIVHGPMWATGTTGDDHEEDAGAGGTIKKQFDVVVDGVTCQDELRDALANPDTEHVGLFDEEEEEAELLFRVFRQFVIGGSMCQWEDNVRPYLAVTQSTYRDSCPWPAPPHRPVGREEHGGGAAGRAARDSAQHRATE
ncbi:hypothetical protein FNF28_07796 [Cafeteria roenbergensis]|uniref:Cilia- and flagella-associated protein 300 n=1 Tax=Cafeteria roenbergensis TaxID=33653 RepID=A0A5A8BYL3_CAFRO|nr:hypothetical protein FNF28_07796 [Cafeteria roenbergensis]